MTVIQHSFATAGKPRSSVPYGRDPNYDAGTAGDVFVDGVNGLDTNTGLSPAQAVKTIAKAYNVVKTMSGNLTIRVMGDGVKYREAVTTNLNVDGPGITSLSIKSYGTDKPWISGAEVVTGFTACVSGDATVVGSNWANVYKATIPLSTITGHSSYWRMMLRENGEPLKLAQVRGNNDVPPFFLDSSLTMMSSATDPTLSIALNGSNQISTITHMSLLPNYTDTQLQQTVAAILVYPNFVRHFKTASVSGSVLTMAANTNNFNGSTTYFYNLLNLAAAIEQGGWAYRVNGANLDIYVWPNDPASLTSGIDIAARKLAWKHTNTNSKPVRFEGLGFEMVASDDGATDNGLLNLNLGNNITVSQCHFRFNSGQQTMMLYDKWGSNIRYEYLTIEYGQGSYGCGMDGQSGALGTGNRVANCFFSDLSFTPSRHQYQSLMAVTNIFIRRTSAGGHANTHDFKSGSDRCVCVGLVVDMSDEGRPVQGYATNASSSRIYYLHSTFPTNSDGRAYVDQTQSVDVLPYTGGDNALINCWVPHELGGTWSTYGALMVGRTSPASNWKVYNCISPTIVAAGGTVDRKNNLLTYSSATTGGTDETKADYATTVYNDPDNRDWAAKAGSPLTTKAGYNVESIVAQLEAWFPDVDFRKDAWGRAWDPAQPGVGPWGNLWPAAPSAPTGA